MRGSERSMPTTSSKWSASSIVRRPAPQPASRARPPSATPREASQGHAGSSTTDVNSSYASAKASKDRGSSSSVTGHDHRVRANGSDEAPPGRGQQRAEHADDRD